MTEPASISGIIDPDSDRGPSPRKVAMDCLARREHSRAELCAKLIKKDIDADEAEATVARLAEQGLVSDERFAEAFVAARIRKGQGPVRLRLELEQRGVSDRLIEQVVAAAGVDWAALARSVREKKHGADVPGEYRERAKQMRFLQYRGFTHEQIQRALGEDDFE